MAKQEQSEIYRPFPIIDVNQSLSSSQQARIDRERVRIMRADTPLQRRARIDDVEGQLADADQEIMRGNITRFTLRALGHIYGDYLLVRQDIPTRKTSQPLVGKLASIIQSLR